MFSKANGHVTNDMGKKKTMHVYTKSQSVFNVNVSFKDFKDVVTLEHIL